MHLLGPAYPLVTTVDSDSDTGEYQRYYQGGKGPPDRTAGSPLWHWQCPETDTDIDTDADIGIFLINILTIDIDIDIDIDIEIYIDIDTDIYIGIGFANDDIDIGIDNGFAIFNINTVTSTVCSFVYSDFRLQ